MQLKAVINQKKFTKKN